MLIKVTTGKPVSEYALERARPHSHTARNGASAGSTRTFHEAEAAFRILQRTTTENDDRSSVPSPTTLRPRQNAIPTQPLFLPFIAQGENDVTTGCITFILCPFGQRCASISHLLNTYFLGYSHRPTYTSNMYNTSKLVPVRKGRFTHTIPGFRLGTVFFTAPYYPQANGLAESTNKILQMILRKIVNKNHTD